MLHIRVKFVFRSKLIMNRYLFVLFTLLVLDLQVGFGQNFFRNKQMAQIDRAEEFIDTGEFRKADSLLRDVMNEMRVLPSKLAFFFGKNSFNLGLYKQCINWLNKYIELKGTSGRYSEEAKKYLDLADKAYLKQREVVKQKRPSTPRDKPEKEVYIPYVSCDGDKVVCPVCKGSGTVIVNGTLGKKYKVCPYSGQKGYMSCDDYNLFIQGKLSADY